VVVVTHAAIHAEDATHADAVGVTVADGDTDADVEVDADITAASDGMPVAVVVVDVEDAVVVDVEDAVVVMDAVVADGRFFLEDYLVFYYK